MTQSTAPTLSLRDVRRVRGITLFRIVNDTNGNPRGLFELTDRTGDVAAHVDRGYRHSSPSDVALTVRELRGDLTWGAGPEYRLRTIDVERGWLRNLRSTIADRITAPVVLLPTPKG